MFDLPVALGEVENTSCFRAEVESATMVPMFIHFQCNAAWLVSQTKMEFESQRLESA